MSVFHPGSVVKRESPQRNASLTHPHEPVLITEQQVLFSTAVAAGSPTRRGIVAILSHSMSTVAMQWRARAARRPVHKYYPPHLSYLEHSLMAREMDRL